MNLRISMAAAGLAAGLALGMTSTAQAAFVDVTPAGGNSPLTNPNTVSFSPSPVTKVLWADKDTSGYPNNQSAGTIGSSIETEFGLSSGSLALVDQENDLSGYSKSFNFNSPVNYIAIHYDSQELYFYYASGVSSFTIGENNPLPKEISNMRSYSAVPVPAALPLLLTALGGMGLIARRKSAA